MRIAIVGAGAIGGYLGGWLAAAGEDVTYIARGANLDALRSHGMRVIGPQKMLFSTSSTGLVATPVCMGILYLTAFFRCSARRESLNSRFSVQ